MQFVRRLICATLVNIWPLPVWRSSFNNVKNHREHVVGGTKKQKFDSLDLWDARFFLMTFDHFCQNFCKIKQYIKKILLLFMWINWKNSSCESLLYPWNFLYPSLLMPFPLGQYPFQDAFPGNGFSQI